MSNQVNIFDKQDQLLRKALKSNLFRLIFIETNNVDAFVKHLEDLDINFKLIDLSILDFEQFYNEIKRLPKNSTVLVLGLNYKLNSEIYFSVKLNQARDILAKLNLKLIFVVFEGTLRYIAKLMPDLYSFRNLVLQYHFIPEDLIFLHSANLQEPVDSSMLKQIEQEFNEIIKNKLVNVSLLTLLGKKLTSAYVQHGNIQGLWYALDRLFKFSEQQVVNDLIIELLDSFPADVLEELYRRYEKKLSDITKLLIFLRLAEFKDPIFFQKAIEIFNANRGKLSSNPNVISNFILFSPDYSTALQWFEQYKDVLSKNAEALLFAYGGLILKSPTYKEAEVWFNQFKQLYLQPNELVYGALIFKSPNFEHARKWFKLMRQQGLKPDELIYNLLLFKAPDYKTAVELLESMKKENIKPNALTLEVLISRFGRKSQHRQKRIINDFLRIFGPDDLVVVNFKDLKLPADVMLLFANALKKYLPNTNELLNLILGKLKSENFELYEQAQRLE